MAFSIHRRAVLKIGLAGAGALALPMRRAGALEGIKITHFPGLSFTLQFVAQGGGYFKREGLTTELLISPAGARSAQMLAAGQTQFVLGDTAHPQRLTEQGKPSVVLFACDRKCPYSSLIVRKDLYDAGLDSLEKVATFKPKDGGKLRAGATAIGSGTWLYGNYVLRSVPAGDGKTANDMVDWQGLGTSSTQLAALKTGKIDLVAAAPEILIEAAHQGTAKVLFDSADDAAWMRVFKGPVAVVGGYALKSTTEQLKDETQAYVTASYKATQWMKQASPAEIADVLKPFKDTIGISEETVVEALGLYKKMWLYDLDYSRENYQNGVNVAQGIKAEKVFPYEQVVDLSFLKKAQGHA